MRHLLAALLLCSATSAFAAVLNVEFNFTPYTGDRTAAKKVMTVPGKATVYINNVQVAEQQIDKHEEMVLFDDHEVSPAIWAPMASMGPVVRKGKNKFRIEFVPDNAKAAYEVQLRWASATDQETRTEEGPGRVQETNQSGEGAINQHATGKVVFEREFEADFATDQPWHHYPAVSTLTDSDRQALAALVAERADTFKPDFAAAYKVLGNAKNTGAQLDMEGIRHSKILSKAYAAGLRIKAPSADKLDFAVTGNPEVVIRAKEGPLFNGDPNIFKRIKGEEMQLGLAILLGVLYPPQLVAVRDPSGKWVVVY